jgi:hypothetical protein
MRTMHSLVSPLAAAAFYAVTAVSPVWQTAVAQTAVAAEHVRPDVNTARKSDDAIVRTVAIYKFNPARQPGMPAEVTVSDSVGVILASFRLPGGNAIQPMMVDVIDTGLVLQGETPSGVLTLVLFQKDAEAASTVVGRWTLGTQQGDLLGRTVR